MDKYVARFTYCTASFRRKNFLVGFMSEKKYATNKCHQRHLEWRLFGYMSMLQNGAKNGLLS